MKWQRIPTEIGDDFCPLTSDFAENEDCSANANEQGNRDGDYLRHPRVLPSAKLIGISQQKCGGQPSLANPPQS
jgi:hypothetical protein